MRISQEFTIRSSVIEYLRSLYDIGHVNALGEVKPCAAIFSDKCMTVVVCEI